jgi:hypothetical protein
MRRHPISLIIGAVLLVGAASQAVTSGPQTLLYEVKLKSSLGDMGTRTMYVKGNSLRWEGKVDKLPMLVVRNSKGTFLIHPWYKIAARYPKDSTRNDPGSYLPGPVEAPKVFLARMNATKGKQEKAEGQLCDVYSYYSKVADRDCRLWVSTKTQKPVKLVLAGVKKKKDTVTAIYTKFVVGAKVPDSLFEIPKGYAIRDMPRPKLASSDTANSKPRKPI